MPTFWTRVCGFVLTALPAGLTVCGFAMYAYRGMLFDGMTAASFAALTTAFYLRKSHFFIRMELPKYPPRSPEHSGGRPPIADELADELADQSELTNTGLRTCLIAAVAAGMYWLLHDAITASPVLRWAFLASSLLPFTVLIVRSMRLNRWLTRFNSEQAAIRLELIRPFLTEDLQDAANWSDADWADIDWSSEDWAAYDGLPDVFKLQAMEVRMLALRTADRSLEALRTVDFFDGYGSQAELQMGCNRIYILADLNDHERASEEFERLRRRFGETFDFRLYLAPLSRQLQLDGAEELIEATRQDLGGRDWPAESRLGLYYLNETPLEFFEMGLRDASRSPADLLAEIRELTRELFETDTNDPS